MYFSNKKQMPNYCENWVRISGDENTLQLFESQPFRLDLADAMPEGLQGYEGSQWIDAYWGTRWIASLGKDEEDDDDIRVERVTDGSIQAFFISAWCPPIQFYNRLAEKYPSVRIEYEYTEWGVGFCGHGVGQRGGEPNHYNFGSREQMRALIEMRPWSITIWDPHYMAEDQNGQPMDVR